MPDPDDERRAASDRARQRDERERRGWRRWRPGPGRSNRPWQFAEPSRERQQEALDHEVDIIENAVAEHGVIGVDTLQELIGARYWGPGRFRPAVRTAVEEGRIVRHGRGKVGPVSDDM